MWIPLPFTFQNCTEMDRSLFILVSFLKPDIFPGRRSLACIRKFSCIAANDCVRMWLIRLCVIFVCLMVLYGLQVLDGVNAWWTGINWGINFLGLLWIPVRQPFQPWLAADRSYLRKAAIGSSEAYTAFNASKVYIIQAIPLRAWMHITTSSKCHYSTQISLWNNKPTESLQ